MSENVELPPAAHLLKAALGLKEGRKYFSSLSAIRRARAIDPHSHELKAALGEILWNCGEYDDAETWLLNAIDADPDNSTIWAHLALTYTAQRKWVDADRAYGRAIELAPDNVAIKWNRACFLLASGQHERGFIDYETRIEVRGPPLYQKLPHPTWNGEDLSGKTLLVLGEQGVGDTIMVSRYLDALHEKYNGITIKWFTQPRLHDLFWEFRDIAELWPAGHPWPDADYAIYQMSLIRYFPDVPKDTGRLLKRAQASAASVKMPEPRTPSLKIGISWTGNPAMLSNEERSMPIEPFLKLAENPNYTLYSLQVGAGASDLEYVGCGDLVYDTSKDLSIMGFAGTAALMLNLDLVITVCTSNAHLAGALGVPCWTLLSYAPYWFWGTEGDTSAYYPNMKIFRQPAPGDWQSVMDQVEAELAELVRSKQLNHAA